tara:strand:- start:75 stop:428 length:354 start_codon:yes stop_codon:yes gene_type:complete
LQAFDRETKSCQHSANLTIASFSENQSEIGSASITAEHLQLLSGGTSGGMTSIRQENASSQSVQIRFLDMTAHTDFIGPCHFVGGVRQSLGEFTIISQQQQSRAFLIQSSNGEEAGA